MKVRALALIVVVLGVGLGLGLLALSKQPVETPRVGAGENAPPVTEVAPPQAPSTEVAPTPAAPAKEEPPPNYDISKKRAALERLPRPMFREVTKEMGITFVHSTDPRLRGMRARLTIPLGIAGGGVAAGDVDGDGFDDLYLAGAGGGVLYRNLSGKGFKDITSDAGLKLRGEARMPTLIDFDNDGDLDLFITFGWSEDRLFLNDGKGRFTEQTQELGLDKFQDMSHEACWVDIDNDGLLDLYVACFGEWPRGISPVVGKENMDGGINRFYRHGLVDGKHVLVEMAKQLGIDDSGWTHCVGAWDFDEDGWQDLFSLNDFARSGVYKNQGGEVFEEWSMVSGVPSTYNAMNFALGDVDGDLRMEAHIAQIASLIVIGGKQYRYKRSETPVEFQPLEMLGKFQGTVTNLMLSPGRSGELLNRHRDLIEPAEFGWAWDSSFFDYDNDGDQDFLLLNGTDAKPPRLEGETREAHLLQAEFVSMFANDPNFFHVNEGGYLYDASALCELAYKGNSRAGVFFDFDHDGDLDVVLNDFESPARLYENLQSLGNSWIAIELEGTRSNRSAIGADITITASDGKKQRAIVTSSSGYFSMDPLARHFGLGRADGAVTAQIRWPSGIVQEATDLQPGQKHKIKEP